MTRFSLAFSLLLSLSAAAQLPRNDVSVLGGWTNMGNVGAARAFGAGYEHFWTQDIGTEAGVLRAGGRLTEVHATGKAHAFRDRLLSPWVAFGVAHVALDDRERSDAQLTMIFGTGVDVRIAPHLALGGEFRYVPFEVDPRDRFGLTINPSSLLVAARWRF